MAREDEGHATCKFEDTSLSAIEEALATVRDRKVVGKVVIRMR